MKRFYILLSVMLLMLVPMSFIALNASISVNTLTNILSQNIFFPLVYLTVSLLSLMMFITMFLKKSKDYIKMMIFLLIIIGFIYSFDIIKISFYSLFNISLSNIKDETSFLAKSISQLSTILASGTLGMFLLVEEYKKDHVQTGRNRILGLIGGSTLLISFILFLRSYYLFVSLYSKVDFHNILSYQLKRIQYIGLLAQLSRIIFIISLIVMIIYVITRIKEKDKTVLIVGALIIMIMFTGLPFLIVLNNIHLFSVDITRIKPDYLIQKYDYLYTLLNVSAGYNPLISQSSFYIVNALLGMSLISVHLPYYEEELFTKELIKWLPRVIVTFLVVLLAFSSISYYQYITTYTEVDLVKNISFSYEGESGEARIVKFKSNVDHLQDEKMKTFLSTVSYNDQEMTSLSNGDKITIKASYSKEQAKKLRIKVVDDERTFTVSGLTYRFSATNIPTEIKTALKNDATSSFDNYYRNHVKHDSSSYQYSFYKMYFAKDQVGKNDKGIAVFKIEHSYTSFYFIPRKETYYLYAYVDNVNSSYLKKKSNYIVSSTKLETQLFSDNMKELIQNEFRNYSLEEIV